MAAGAVLCFPHTSDKSGAGADTVDMASAQGKLAEKVPRKRIDKFAERRAELGEAALATLASLGYARTSLREIAQNSAFSHGVLHYYFNDKTDLIVCSVRQYKARCVTRYDRALTDAHSYDALMAGFLSILGDTLRDEAHMHRLWYDLRAQSLFEEAFRADVVAIDKSLEDMTWRIVSRFAQLSGVPASMSPAAAYALLDGLFQRCLLGHLSGSPDAIAQLQEEVRQAISCLFGQPACTP